MFKPRFFVCFVRAVIWLDFTTSYLVGWRSNPTNLTLVFMNKKNTVRATKSPVRYEQRRRKTLLPHVTNFKYLSQLV